MSEPPAQVAPASAAEASSSSPSSSPTIADSEITPTQVSPISQSTTLASSPPGVEKATLHTTSPPRPSSSASATQIPDVLPQTSTTEQSVSPNPWLNPTSSELAFLNSLPIPTVRLDEDAAASSSPSVSSGQVLATVTAPVTNRPSAETVSSAQDPVGSTQDPIVVDPFYAEPGHILSAASRAWISNATEDGRVFHRRDTWAVGNKWGRHVRVIEVGGSLSGRKRQPS